ncbi:exonuclease domain-containing protein [Corynebacterium aquatimens]|uniref:DNA polymerase-3 subunit epsilon n=1 Tax=Corynebacterium aquatimens TaxID=1190508 RepID=A0A931E0U7_9CORY|nr:exonuclease domain-containing protein [Corynebacterium aquatimens]MBG6121792.1 DNA polymerase-3 subunit epsilon [Corynebacterium aquatimens]WJY65669.1 hypothetical protein CAQUA_04780 [Corynebacterium aquatimens]
MSEQAGYAVIDLETTGFGGADRIIEVGVVLLDSQLAVTGTWETLVQPERDFNNSHIHKITPTDLVHAPTWEQVAPVLAGVLHGRVGVAHNASFEQRFLSKEFQRVGIANNVREARWVDTKDLALMHCGKGKLAEALDAVGITNAQPHAALPDAQATADLLRELCLGRGTSIAGDALRFDGAPEQVSCELVTRSRAEDPAQWLSRLAQAMPQERTGSTGAYREVLRIALADHALSASEVRLLERTAQAEGLTATDIADIHEDFVRQLAIEAWMDGVITSEEEALLRALAGQLAVDGEVVEKLLREPVTGESELGVHLRPGDRIALTGAMDLPRETWEARVQKHGLVPGGVARSTVVVVAANPDTWSGKAKRARDLGIPVISEKSFARMLATMETSSFDDTAVTGAVKAEQAAVEEAVVPQRFEWIASVSPERGEDELTHAEMAALWIKHYPTRPLTRISSFLGRDTQIDLSGSLAAKAGVTWAARYSPMLSATARDLSDISGVGAKKLERMVEAVILAAIDAVLIDDGEASAPAHGDYVSDLNNPYESGAESPRPRGGLAEEIALLRGWYALTGFEPLPEAVKGAIPAVDKLAGEGDPLEALFARCVGELAAACGDDWRKKAIVTSRHLGDATLEELGQSFGVSRERVRQLESQIQQDLDAGLSGVVASKLAKTIGPLDRLENVYEAMPALAATAEPFEKPYEEYFRLWRMWTVDGDWITSATFGADFDAARSELSNAYNVCSIDELADALGVDSSRLTAWIRERTSLLILPGEEHVVKASSHPDRAAAVLFLHGRPMRVDEIIAATGLDIPTRSVSNSIITDERIIRTGNSMFGLKEWGLETYTSISDWIARRIAESPSGAVALDDLVAEAPRWNISETSVRAYAAGNEFDLSDGMVTLASGEAELIDDDPQDYRDLYWRDGAWHLLVAVGHDHLRGSGFPVPRGVAGIYSVPVGGEVSVPSRLGDQFIRVNKLKQASVSTVRRFLHDMGTNEGERVWLRFAPDNFDVLPAPSSSHDMNQDPTYPAGLAHLLDYMALDPALSSDPEQAIHAVNLALGLDANAPRRRTVAIFRHRGQDNLAEIVRGV